VKTFFMRAITLPIALNERTNLVDPAGQIYVLQESEEAVRADNRHRVPLAIRANAGEDCVDVVLTSELEDNEESHNFSKVNAHIHFVQFDVQASDGVITGFNYEQSVRPYAEEGAGLRSAASAGSSSVSVEDAERFPRGAVVGIGMDRSEPFEIRRVVSSSGGSLELDRPLDRSHSAGEIVSTEFVRYRWYPDVQFGTAYFHDHVNAIASWRHGLFGALVSEPPGSTYRDPHTGAELASGPIADIHTTSRVSADVTGSFREMALFVQDDNPLTAIGRSSGSAFNLRVEPLEDRGDDTSRVFSSRDREDPETPRSSATPSSSDCSSAPLTTSTPGTWTVIGSEPSPTARRRGLSAPCISGSPSGMTSSSRRPAGRWGFPVITSTKTAVASRWRKGVGGSSESSARREGRASVGCPASSPWQGPDPMCVRRGRRVGPSPWRRSKRLFPCSTAPKASCTCSKRMPMPSSRVGALPPLLCCT
jgi:hypothetical protein